jgi:alpha-N-arabinofuranosidase
MTAASIALHPAFTVAPVNRRTFGSFVEHMGRCVYTGIYEPDHPTADARGFRGDVLALTRELGVSLVRYPGGNFVSGYRWEDGVGPVAERPTRRDLAWHTLETNAVGVDEFVYWARQAGVEVMYALNLGTRGVQEALDAHEYMNHPSGTELSERRRSNGAQEPHGFSMFCLGNEMDGPWQTGHKTAHEYGRLAAEVARALRSAEPGLELVACGSSSSMMPTFGAWESTVLELAYDQVDYVSAHAYYEEVDGDLASFLVSAVNMDHFIDSVVATADSVAARLKSTKRINISFDEWNVWYQSRYANAEPRATWDVAPPVIEDHYNVADAVVVGNLLIALLRHSDRVTVACQAQLVNVIAPIMTEPGGRAWRQTIFHPFALTSRLATGTVLRLELNSPTVETQRYGAVPVLDAVATHDEASGEVTIFAVNRDLSEPIDLSVSLAAFPQLDIVETWSIGGADPRETNTADEPDRVVPRPLASATVSQTRLTASLPPVSWSALHLSPAATSQ